MDFTKPKYKNLLSYLHDRNFYKNVDKFTTENNDEILSNFTQEPIDGNRNCFINGSGGKCFCGKKLKNVYYVYCILTNEILSVGGNCKTLFSSKTKDKQRFINRTIHLFKKGLGFEPIFNWDSFIGEALENWLKNNTLEDLEVIRKLYINSNIITIKLNLLINERIEKKEKLYGEEWAKNRQEELERIRMYRGN